MLFTTQLSHLSGKRSNHIKRLVLFDEHTSDITTRNEKRFWMQYLKTISSCSLLCTLDTYVQSISLFPLYLSLTQ